MTQMLSTASQDSIARNQVVRYFEDDGRVLAILIPRRFDEPGVQFFTPPELSQQLAHMRHPEGTTIEPHVHNPVPRAIEFTQEVLFIKRGKLRVDFYSDGRDYLASWILEAGDTLLLAHGGHGFEVLEEVEMIEVKQGPYAGEHDKTRFRGIEADLVKMA